MLPAYRQRFERLYERKRETLLRCVQTVLGSRNDSAEDCVQEAFAVVLAREGEWQLPRMQKLRAIAINRAVQIQRHRAQSRQISKAVFRRLVTKNDGPVDVMEAEIKDILETALRRVPACERKVLELMIFEELDYKETARFLLVDAYTVLKLRWTGLKRLRRALLE
jgi:RNA polymerase sigma factor (sigma-70 family)